MFHVEQPKPHRWPVGIFSVPRGTPRISLRSVRSRGQRTPVLSELLFHNTGAVPYETIRIEHHRPQGIGHHRLFHVEPFEWTRRLLPPRRNTNLRYFERS